MRKTAIYTRVSTGYQVDKDSLPYQRQECQSYCRLILHVPDEEMEIYEDAGKSGKNTDRPGFQRMMRAVKAGSISRVVVLKIDRISRNLVDFSMMYEDFKEHEVSFISLNEQFDTSSAMGEAMLKIILVFAELERKMTSERVTGVMIGRAKNGDWNGARVPFGWEWDPENKKPVHHPVEGPLVIQMYEMYLQHSSSCQLRDYLNSHDIPTKRGGEWTSKTVADIIRNPLNKGDYRYNYRQSARGKKKSAEDVIYIKGLYEPLVDPDVWDRANAIMDGNTRLKNKPGQPHSTQYPHIFQRLLYCADCGSPYAVRSLDTMRKNGFRPSAYICGRRYRKRACMAPGVSDVTLGPFILNYVSHVSRAAAMSGQFHSSGDLEDFLLSGPEFADIVGIDQEGLEQMYSLYCAGAKGTWTADPVKPAAVSTAKISELQGRIARADRALERLKKAYLFSDDSMSEREFLEMRDEIESERVSAQNELRDLQTEDPISTNDLAFFRSASGWLLAHHLNTDDHIEYSELAAIVQPDVLRDFIRTVIRKITVKDKRIYSIEFQNGIVHRFLYR